MQRPQAAKELMPRYTVYYPMDGWQHQQEYLVQTVRQPIPDGRILVVDLWKNSEAGSPIILRITPEGQANQPSLRASDFATRLLPQDIALVPV